jgi:hypothetical protein
VTCRVVDIIVHAHGQDADLDAFFTNLSDMIEKAADEAPKLWPSIEILPPDLAALLAGEDEWDPDGDDDYKDPPV